MKNLSILAVACTALLSCTNGKNPQGTPVDTDTLPAPETVATLDPNAKPDEASSMGRTASFLNFFQAEVNNEGMVECQFMNLDEETFSQIFNMDNCPTDKFALEASGRVKGICILNEGSSVDPVLFLLMEDNHAERVSLWELSCGKQKTIYRSADDGITMFEEYSDPNGEWEGNIVVGIDADGNRIELDWSAL
ncbi:MAG: hypothetical protein KBT12_08130 [Bacteroidales bacterium]|nr:hypothetical protein [Candidatus Physcousia equi]